MKDFIRRLMLRLLFSNKEVGKLTTRQRMIAYKDAYRVENLKELLENQNKAREKYIALQGKDSDEIWYYRGMIASNQSLLKKMKDNFKLWVDEQESQKK